MLFSNKVYDVLKEIAQVWLPALGTLYFVLSRIWGWPYCEGIVGTIAAVDAFLGVVLHIDTKAYYAHLNETPGQFIFSEEKELEDHETI